MIAPRIRRVKAKLSRRKLAPVLQDLLSHLAGGFEKPMAWFAPEVAQDGRGTAAAKMNVGRFPAHAMQQTQFVPLVRQMSQFQPEAVGRQPPRDPIGTPLFNLCRDAGVELNSEARPNISPQ
jgi:hypothetical protein